MRLNNLLLAAALAAFATAANAEGAGKIQCWKDKDGNRMCGDRVPPEYAGQKREVIEGGRVVETVRGAKTAAELAEEERKKKEAEEAQKRADHDHMLLESYRNVKDIENKREESLAMLDTRIKGAERSVVDNQKTLEELKARAAKAEKPAEGNEAKPADAKLAKQIRQYEKAVTESQKSVERLNGEREQSEKRFEEEIRRYNELRPPAPPKAAKAPG